MKALNDTLKKKIYKSQILQLLHFEKAIPQVDICKRLGLPKTAVSFIVNDAIKSGLIKKLGIVPGQRRVPGTRPVLLGLDDEMSAVLGLSFRDGYFYSGLVNFHGDPDNVKSIKLDNFNPGELPGMILRAVDEAKNSGKNILGVGMALGGYFKETNKRLAPDADYSNILTEIPLIVDDYPNASAKAELLFGKAKGKDSFSFLQLGSRFQRVSSYSNGDVVRGTHGLAGEVSLIKDIAMDSYHSPVRLYQHQKIKNFKESSASEIEEHSFNLANIIIQIMVYYDPRQIIISGIPQEIWDNVMGTVNRVISDHLDFETYGLQYDIVPETQWEHKEIIYGASLIFEDILMRPRISVNDSIIT